jgi:hypothetical protein
LTEENENRKKKLKFYLFFLVVLGFGFMLSRQTPTALAMPSALFVLLFWRKELVFCPGWLGLQYSYFILPTVARMTGTHHHTQLLFR